MFKTKDKLFQENQLCYFKVYEEILYGQSNCVLLENLSVVKGKSIQCKSTKAPL